LQAAQIPVAMLSTLLAVPRTPLYQRLEAAGRIASHSDYSRYEGTNGGTNFRPLRMTSEELRRGQEGLYRRLYAPGAFAERLLGNLGRFHDVTYRPEPVRLDQLAICLRVIRHYWRRGKVARRFFWGILRRTLRSSPRSLAYVVQMLGLYKHFCEVHAHSAPWDPWAAPPRERRPGREEAGEVGVEDRSMSRNCVKNNREPVKAVNRTMLGNTDTSVR
jgi:hypothetical protein